MEEQSANPCGFTCTEPAGNGWLIDLFAVNEPVDIPTPKLPPPLQPSHQRLNGARAHQYPRLILALVCLPVFIGALDLTIVSAVLPEVIRSMTVEIQKLDVAGWVVTGYFVSYAISMTFMGKVSDISRPPHRLSRLPGDLLRRLVAGRGLARLAGRRSRRGSCTVFQGDVPIRRSRRSMR